MKIENKGIVKNGFFSIMQILISTACYFLIYYLILTKLGKEQLGIWSFMSSVPAALTVFGSGVSGCLVRYIPIYVAKKDSAQLNQIIASGFIFNLIVASAAVLLGYYFSDPILRFLFSTSHIPALYTLVYNATLIIFLLNFVSSVFLYGLEGLQLIHKKNTIMIISVLGFSITAFFFIQAWGLMGLLYAQIVQAITVLVFSVYVLFRVKLFTRKHMILNIAHFKLFLSYGQSFQLISIFNMLFEPVTKFFLNQYFNLSIVGLYDIVNRVISQIRSLIVSAILVIVPVVSRLNEEKSLDVNDLYKKAVRGGSLLSIISYSSLIVIAVPVISQLDHKDLNFYMVFLIALSIAFVVNIISSSAYAILTGMGKLRTIIFSHILSTGINLGLFILIRYWPFPEMMILPPSCAILLSSLYIIYNFRKNFALEKISVAMEDVRIYLVAGTALLLAMIFYITSLRPVFIYGLISVYVPVISYLMLNNTFLLNIKHRLFAGEKSSLPYGT